MSRIPGERLSRGDLIISAIAIPVAAVLVFVFFFRADNETKNLSKDNTSVTIETSTPGVPFLTHGFKTGDYVHIGKNMWVCSPHEANALNTERCWEQEQLKSDDYVQVTGEAKLLDKGEYYPGGRWYWPVNVVQAGVYSEGSSGFLADDDWIFGPISTLPTRTTPDFKSGETVLVSFNFVLRRTPAGDPWVIGSYGYGAMVYGGAEVTLATEPTPGPDGRYWCGFYSSELADFNGLPADTLLWIPCELQKE